MFNYRKVREKLQCHDNRVDFTQLIYVHFVEQVHEISLQKHKRIDFQRNNQRKHCYFKLLYMFLLLIHCYLLINMCFSQ